MTDWLIEPFEHDSDWVRAEFHLHTRAGWNSLILVKRALNLPRFNGHKILTKEEADSSPKRITI